MIIFDSGHLQHERCGDVITTHTGVFRKAAKGR